jgi:hypothetical protein
VTAFFEGPAVLARLFGIVRYAWQSLWILVAFGCAGSLDRTEDSGATAPDAGSVSDSGAADSGTDDAGAADGGSGNDAGSNGCDGGSSFGDVQTTVLAQCGGLFGCHTTSPYAGGLDLTVPDAYAALVNVPSTVNPAILRVEPGAPLASMLYLKLTDMQGPNGQLPMPFHEGLPWKELPPDQIALVSCWISDGALNTPSVPTSSPARR